MSITSKIERLRNERRVQVLPPAPTVLVQKITGHPELEGREHLLTSHGLSEYMGGYADYAQVYGVYAWVKKAVGLIAGSISPLPVLVVDPDEEEQPDHPISQMLAYANDSMDTSDLWERWVVDMMLAGEAFIEIVNSRAGQPLEMWPRRPDEVKIIPDKSAERQFYPRVLEYRLGDDELVIPVESMAHDKFFNPLNPWRGLAPIAALRQGITIDLFAQAWSRLFLKRGARPDFALIAPDGITRTEKEDLVDTLLAGHSGPEGWHRPIALEKGVVDIKPLNWTPKDIEWLEQRRFARDEVAAVFGVPDEIMGYGRDTYENFDTAYKVLWLLTLLKLIEKRDRGLTHHFTKVRPLLQEGWEVQTDLSGVGAIQDDLAPKAEVARSFWEMGVPFNLLDERLGLGFGEIEGGDVGYVPMSMVPVERKLEPPAPPPQFLLPPGGGEEETPPPEEGEEEEEEPAPPQRATGPPRRGWDLKYGSPYHVAAWKAFDRRLRQHELRMKAELKRHFQRQQNQVLEALRSLGKGFARTIKDNPDPAALAEIIEALQTAINWELEELEFVKKLGPFYGDAIKEFGDAQMSELGVGIAFDMHNPLVMEVARGMPIKFAKDIEYRTRLRMDGAVREIVQEAEIGGWGIPEIQREVYDRISEVFNVRKADYQTERIARTEMGKAANIGKLHGMAQSEVVERKSWLAALDGRCRPTHSQAHADYFEEGIPINDMFHVGGDEMLCPGGGSDPGENINCRCTTVPKMAVPSEQPAAEPAKTTARSAADIRKEITGLHKEHEVRRKELLAEEKRINGSVAQNIHAGARLLNEGVDPYGVPRDPRFEALMRERDKLQAQLSAISKEKRALAQAYKSKMRETLYIKSEDHLKGVKATLRADFSKAQRDNIESTLADLQPMVSSKHWIAQRPDEDRWVAFNSFGASGGRANYMDHIREIMLDRGDGPKVIMHELGHFIEGTDNDVRLDARAFLRRRTKGESAEWLGDHYDKHETAKRDKFLRPYMGKIYRDYTEIISMGMEYLYMDPYELADKDPDYFDFMINVLRRRPVA